MQYTFLRARCKNGGWIAGFLLFSFIKKKRKIISSVPSYIKKKILSSHTPPTHTHIHFFFLPCVQHLVLSFLSWFYFSLFSAILSFCFLWLLSSLFFFFFFVFFFFLTFTCIYCSLSSLKCSFLSWIFATYFSRFNPYHQGTNWDVTVLLPLCKAHCALCLLCCISLHIYLCHDIKSTLLHSANDYYITCCPGNSGVTKEKMTRLEGLDFLTDGCMYKNSIKLNSF